MNKKIIIAILLLFSIPILFFTARMFLPEEKIVFDQTNKTFVVKGDVKIKHAKEPSQWQQMEPSTMLEKGDVVETAEGSSVDIIIGKDTNKAVKLGENSHVEFQEINPAYLDCSKGKVMVSLKKVEPKSSFTIKTPTAICGARGTAWSEQASPNNTRICVFENKVYVKELDSAGQPKAKEHTVVEGTERRLLKDKPISEAEAIINDDMEDWKYWNKNVEFLRGGKILINDFNKKENFNNLGGAFGSWVVFYSDTHQHCRDEFSALERMGDSGYCLKLDYSVNSPFSAYNGFFTKLMGIDLSDYHYLIFYIKGDKNAGFTTRIDVELKNKLEIGKIAVKGITDEWKKMILPLDKFIGIKSFNNMKELVMVFSDVNATKKEGVVYIDNIYFAKEDS